ISGSPRLHLTASNMTAELDGAARHVFDSIAYDRLTAVALAARLYAVDHGGALPPSLEALVPGYLAAVPVDPMVAGGAPLRYKASAADPIVYSVGEDATDDGGSSQPTRPNRDHVGRPDRWFCKDGVLHLKRQAR